MRHLPSSERAGSFMARRAWWLLERTEVPHTMQKVELSSSRFSHSGQ